MTNLAVGTLSLPDSLPIFSLTCSETVSQPSALSMSACSETDVTCNGGSNGTASAGTVSNKVGAIQYRRSNRQRTRTPTNLAAGTYTLTVSDNCFSLTCSET